MEIRPRFNRVRRKRDGEWRSLVARFVRDEEVPGSNPGSPTTIAITRNEPATWAGYPLAISFSS